MKLKTKNQRIKELEKELEQIKFQLHNIQQHLKIIFK